MEGINKDYHLSAGLSQEVILLFCVTVSLGTSWQMWINWKMSTEEQWLDGGKGRVYLVYRREDTEDLITLFISKGLIRKGRELMLLSGFWAQDKEECTSVATRQIPVYWELAHSRWNCLGKKCNFNHAQMVLSAGETLVHLPRFL